MDSERQHIDPGQRIEREREGGTLSIQEPSEKPSRERNKKWEVAGETSMVAR